MAKYRSYCFTVRPGSKGLNPLPEWPSFVGALTSWLKRQEFAVAVEEMSSTEAVHIHGQVWLPQPGREKGKINSALQSICERSFQDWQLDNLRCLRKGTTIAYSDWYHSYLEDNELKVDEVKHIINNPPHKTQEYYPSEAEQELVQARAHAADPKLFRWEQHWFLYKSEKNIDTCSFENCTKFVYYIYNVARLEQLPRSRREIREHICLLYGYINKLTIEVDFKAMTEMST